MSINYYSAYNLVIQSQLMLPSLQVVPETNASVSIIYGSVSQNGLSQPVTQGLTYQSTMTDFWLNIPSVARFLVSNGEQITVEPFVGIDENSIRTFLLSTCMEVLLRQRQLTIIQGYGIKLGDYGVAFAGNLGVGQSMLQGLFYKHGHAFLAGNFFALTQDGTLLPGVAQLEFWPPVLSALGFATEALSTLRPNIKKYVIPLAQQYYAKSLPLKVIYLWRMHHQTEILFSEIDVAENSFYLQQLMRANNQSVDLWQDKNTTPLLGQVQIICIHVPAKGLKLQQLADAIERDLVERGHCYA